MKTIKQEQKEAYEKYGHFNSTHEVYGVLMEEVEEFWELVRIKTIEGEGLIMFDGLSRDTKKASMISELTQISAIAQRAVNELDKNQIKWV